MLAAQLGCEWRSRWLVVCWLLCLWQLASLLRLMLLCSSQLASGVVSELASGRVLVYWLLLLSLLWLALPGAPCLSLSASTMALLWVLC